ncbi:MAG: hypothetical protein GX593_02105 [Actinomycetales bacterium]|nr:hypothetical protein [Actinomycetales bacterium]
MGSATAASLAVVLALGGGGSLALPAARDASVPDDGHVWSIDLSGVDRSAVASSPTLQHERTSTEHEHTDGQLAAMSPELATDEFTLAAVSWEPDAKDLVTSVALRVREGGQWSEWYEVGTVESDESGVRMGSEPVIAPDADGVQARVETASGRVPTGLRIDLVEPSADPARSTRAGVAPQAATGDELMPAIVTRSDWGANEKKTRNASRSKTLKAMYVHHTAGSNTYAQD